MLLMVYLHAYMYSGSLLARWICCTTEQKRRSSITHPPRRATPRWASL